MGAIDMIEAHAFPSPSPSPSPSPAASSSSEASFPVLAISIVGILATAILLLSYYVFVIKCCRHHTHTVLSTSTSTSFSRRSGAGLDESTIQAIPTVVRCRRSGDVEYCTCAVCLNEFREEVRIRMLPNCFHVFHIDCIDTWLQTHANCPLCRAPIATS